MAKNKHKRKNNIYIQPPAYQVDKQPKDYSFYFKLIRYLSLLILGLLILPFFQDGIPSGHDISIHLVYLRQFYSAFQQGQFPVRVIEWITPGFDQPVFNFYPPGFYYLFLIPKLMGFSNDLALRFINLFLWFFGGLLFYQFAKIHYSRLASLLAAIFYLFAPYHISDLFVRAALPEFTALAFIPGVFWALGRFAKSGRGTYLLFGSIFTALVLLSHPPTMLMFSGLILGYLIYLYFQTKSVSKVILSISSLVLGLGIAGFFIVPAILEQPLIQAVYLKSGYYNYQNHFVCLYQYFFPNWGYGTSNYGCFTDGMSFQLGTVHLLIVLVAFYLLVIKKIIDKFRFKKSINLGIEEEPGTRGVISTHLWEVIMLIYLVIVLYMGLKFSQPIWDAIELLQFIQYPWRFLAVGIFIASLLSAFCLDQIKTESRRYLTYGLLVLAVALFYGFYLRPAKYITADELDFNGPKIIKNAQVEDIGLLPENGYYPKGTEVLPASKDVPPSELRFLSGEGDIISAKLSPTTKQYRLTVTKDAKVQIFTHYFPGWELKLDNKVTQIERNNIYNYIQLNLSSGTHQIDLQFKDTPLRQLANLISIGSLILAFGFVMVRKSTKKVNTF